MWGGAWTSSIRGLGSSHDRPGVLTSQVGKPGIGGPANKSLKINMLCTFGDPGRERLHKIQPADQSDAGHRR